MCDVCCYFKQKTSYELRISDWSSDVCSSDLVVEQSPLFDRGGVRRAREGRDHRLADRTHKGARYLAKSRGEINDSDAFESPEMIGDQAQDGFGQKLHREIRRAHVRTQVNNAQLVCRPLLEKKKNKIIDRKE